MAGNDALRVEGLSRGLDTAIDGVHLSPGAYLLVVGIRQLVAPADAAGDVGQLAAIHVLIFSKVRLRAVVATHGLPAGSLDDVVQLAVHEQRATLLGTPAASQRDALVAHALGLGHLTLVEDESQPQLVARLRRGIDGDVFRCRDVARCHTVQRAALKPARAAGIDIVYGPLNGALLVVAARLLLGTMGVLVARYPATVERGTVAVYMQCQRLTATLACRVLKRQVLSVEVGGKDTQRGIVAHVLATAYVILAMGCRNDGLVHPLAYQRNLLCRSLLACAQLHGPLVGAGLHTDDSLLALGHGIDGGLHALVVARTVLSHRQRALRHCRGAQHQQQQHSR